MATSGFSYEAIEPDGAVQRGYIEASSRLAALNDLARRGLTALDVRESPASEESASVRPDENRRRRRSRRARATTRELLELCESLSSLLGAGLTIDRALQISRDVAKPSAVRALTEQLLTAIRGGQSVSEAFRTSGQALPNYFPAMIAAGEAGGTLSQSMSRLSELQRQQLEFWERVRAALVYPALLCAVLLLTLIVLLGFVLPRFESMFAESEAPLPWSTQTVLWVGRFVADEWWALLLGAAVVAVAMGAWLRTQGGIRARDSWLIRSHWLRGLPAALSMARFLRTLATLLESGMPLHAGLRVSQGTLSNLILADQFREVNQRVQEGEAFSAALGRFPAVPGIVTQMARVGEETGTLAPLLHAAANSLERDSQKTLQNILTLLVPILTLVMGGLVAGLIGSVLLGLLSVNDLAF